MHHNKESKKRHSLSVPFGHSKSASSPQRSSWRMMLKETSLMSLLWRLPEQLPRDESVLNGTTTLPEALFPMDGTQQLELQTGCGPCSLGHPLLLPSVPRARAPRGKSHHSWNQWHLCKNLEEPHAHKSTDSFTRDIDQSRI